MAAEAQDQDKDKDSPGVPETSDRTRDVEAALEVATDASESVFSASDVRDADSRLDSGFSNISLSGGQKKEDSLTEHLDHAGDVHGDKVTPAGSEHSDLPPSDARITSHGFFQDEDDDAGKFTLDDGDLSPLPPMPEGVQDSAQAAAAIASQDATEDDAPVHSTTTSDAAAAQDDLPPTSASHIATPAMPTEPMPLAPLPMPPPGVEPEEFKGLLFYDGMDNVGRPVVVINARAEAMLQAKLRVKAMAYMTARLEPIVKQGPYVLILVASGHQGDTSSRLPALWLIKAYRSLSRPYKKNVKFIVLVRPSAMLRAILLLLRPFLSLKAARKLHKVDSLLDIDTVTGGDVTAESTGARFLREELGVEPGSLLPPVEAQQRAEQLDSEVQLGSF